ncbi:molybdopterin-dependent oxidoreductase [Streptomyces sp. NPDC001880]
MGLNDKLKALPTAHGAPLRVVVPGWIGVRSVKWLKRITAQAEPSDSYFAVPPGGARRTEATTVSSNVLMYMSVWKSLRPGKRLVNAMPNRNAKTICTPV